MILDFPIPFRPTASEQLPPLLAPGDGITVKVGPNVYPGLIVGVVDAERVRVCYFDKVYDLYAERSMPMDACELAL